LDWQAAATFEKEELHMRRTLVLASLMALGVTAAFAQSAAIGQRKDQLKAMGAAMGPIGKMIRGEDPLDLAKVQAGLKVVQANAKTLPTLFPDDSKTGDTKALPVIWTDNAKFKGYFAKLDADATAALAAIKDEATLKSEMPKVLGNCGTCHNEFRAK
jgi:cytochrome c556